MDKRMKEHERREEMKECLWKEKNLSADEKARNVCIPYKKKEIAIWWIVRETELFKRETERSIWKGRKSIWEEQGNCKSSWMGEGFARVESKGKEKSEEWDGQMNQTKELEKGVY